MNNNLLKKKKNTIVKETEKRSRKATPAAEKRSRKATPAVEKSLPVLPVRIIPLGGLDRIGMNITAIEYGDMILVVDCGISFPDEGMPGIDKIIPDVTYLQENREKVKGFFITHGHEDHIGALPYILPQLNVPVYATKLTMGLIEQKLSEAGILEQVERHVEKQGGSVTIGPIRVEFIKTNHSIAGASALAFHTPAGVIFHTGDFKVDYTPLFGDAINLQRIAELGAEGVLAVLSDSTNALRPGYTPSETMVARTFNNLFASHTKSRIIVATFASNVDRVQQLLNTAKTFGRKVILQGRSMEQVIAIASELGYVKVPKNTLIGIDEMGNYPDDKLVFITTGSQGEDMAALSRMANSTHKKIAIKPGDVIVLSSSPIPGNEKSVSRIINELSMKGAEVIHQDTHVSGHACQQELQMIYTLLKPRFAIPIHGEFRHRRAAAELVEALGIPKERVFLIQAGDVLSLEGEAGSVTNKVPAKGVYVDGLGIGDIGNAVLRDRQHLAENGIVMVSLVIDRENGAVLAGPEIVTRGVVYLKESTELLAELKDIVLKTLENEPSRHATDLPKIRSDVKNGLESYMWSRFNREPIVIPVIMEIGG